MSANRVCDISYSRGHEFLQALEKAGLTGAIAQQVINSKGNQAAKAMLAALGNDERFRLVTSFHVVVPQNYSHATRLDSFRKERGGEFYHFNDAITDHNFARATTPLVPDRKLKVQVFQITQRVSSEDCLVFLKRQQAVLVGAQGASLAYEQGKDQLPKGRWHISFDEKKALWKDADGYRRVPFVSAHADGGFGFDLGYFEGGWRDDYCLLAFCDAESSDA